MLSALLYLLTRFIKSIYKFLHVWYIDSFLNMSNFMIGVFENLDQTFALKINARNLFKPLYQDPTFIGYILGPLFRGGRVLIGSAVYLVVFAVSIVLFGLWLLIPIFILYEIIKNYGA